MIPLIQASSFWSHLLLSCHVTNNILRVELDRTTILYYYFNLLILQKSTFYTIFFDAWPDVSIIFHDDYDVFYKY